MTPTRGVWIGRCCGAILASHTHTEGRRPTLPLTPNDHQTRLALLPSRLALISFPLFDVYQKSMYTCTESYSSSAAMFP